jgi:hypothetical protein
MTNAHDRDAVLKNKIARFRELAKWVKDRDDQLEADARNKLADEMERILQGCDADLLRIITPGDDTSIGLRHPSHAKRWMGDPLFLNSPAIRRARKRRAVVSLEGAHSLRDSKHGLSPAMAAITAVICAAVTCIWGYVFTSPNMPGIDPAIEYAWFIPVIPLFNMFGSHQHLG